MQINLFNRLDRLILLKPVLFFLNRQDISNLNIAPPSTPSTRWLTEEMSLRFPFNIDTITAGALMSLSQ